MTIGPLTLSSYGVFGPDSFGVTAYIYTFGFTAPDDAKPINYDAFPYRPMDPTLDGTWGDRTAGEKTINFPVGNILVIDTKRVLTVDTYQAAFPHDPIYGTSDRVMVYVPGQIFIQPNSSAIGDEFYIPFAFPIEFSPALPSWVMDPLPTHVVYGPYGICSLYTSGDRSALRAESIDWPYFTPGVTAAKLNGINGGTPNAIGGPLTDRISMGQSTQKKFAYRNSDGKAYLGYAESDISDVSYTFRHWPFPVVRVVGLRFLSSPANYNVSLVITWYTPGGTSTSTIVVGTYTVDYSVGSSKYCSIDTTADLEAIAVANAPSGTYAITYYSVDVAGTNGLRVTSLRRPYFPPSAIRDSLGPDWLPGRILKLN